MASAIILRTSSGVCASRIKTEYFFRSLRRINLLTTPTSPESKSNLRAFLPTSLSLSSPVKPLDKRIRVERARPVATPQGELPIARCAIRSSVALRITKRGPARVPRTHPDKSVSTQR